MKKLFKLSSFLIVTAIIFSSCDNDILFPSNIGQTYGTITDVTTKGYTIQSDLNNTLVAVNSVTSSFELKTGQRVYAKFFFDSDNGKETLIRVYYITQILTKSPIYFSKMTLAEQEEVGNDPINIIDAWFSCGKYLNIKFLSWRDLGEKPHFINLKVDEENSDSKRVIVEFKHNDYDEARNYKAYGTVSFDISGLVPADKDEIQIELRWSEYSGQESSVVGNFSVKNKANVSVCQYKTESDISDLDVLDK